MMQTLVENAAPPRLRREAGSSIKEGMRLLFEHAGLVVEPAAALGVAAILEDQDRFATKSVATVLCGSNVSRKDFEASVMAARLRPTSGSLFAPASPSS